MDQAAMRQAMNEVGRPDCVTFQVRGFRDLRWCWIVNEPMLPKFTGDRGELLTCELCGWAEPSDDGIPSAAFAAQHPFICHVGKPRVDAPDA